LGAACCANAFVMPAGPATEAAINEALVSRNSRSVLMVQSLLLVLWAPQWRSDNQRREAIGNVVISEGVFPSRSRIGQSRALRKRAVHSGCYKAAASEIWHDIRIADITEAIRVIGFRDTIFVLNPTSGVAHECAVQFGYKECPLAGSDLPLQVLQIRSSYLSARQPCVMEVAFILLLVNYGFDDSITSALTATLIVGVCM
jgi:hypothetical protein